MDICDHIRRERNAGITRCAVVDGRMTVVEAALAFGLADDLAVYRDIERAEADAIASRILEADLAYRSFIMSADRAAELWGRLMALFDGQDAKFATNASWPSHRSCHQPWSWSPATEATFDVGVLVIGTSKAGCLWVEDED
jgi:hypothetical protein